MANLRLSVTTTLIVLAYAASGCSDAEPCSPASCSTCCDANGECVAAVSATACGGGGNFCEACDTGETCYATARRCGAANPAYAFVTKTEYTGNLKAAGGGTTGLLGADNLCQAAAQSAGLTGTFKAWLSDGGTNAIDRLSDVGGWYTLGDYPWRIAASKAQLLTGLSNAFTDETGSHLSSGGVWTGTNGSGTRATSFFQGTTGNCVGWSVDYLGADSGVLGLNGYTSSKWTQDSAQQCHNKARLYCFQQ